MLDMFIEINLCLPPYTFVSFKICIYIKLSFDIEESYPPPNTEQAIVKQIHLMGRVNVLIK